VVRLRCWTSATNDATLGRRRSLHRRARPAAFAPQALRRASPELQRRRAGRSPRSS
jgi:hypothetical protein